MAIFNLEVTDKEIAQVLEPVFGSTCIPLVSSKKLGELYCADIKGLTVEQVRKLRAYFLVALNIESTELDKVLKWGLPIPCAAGTLIVGSQT